MKTLNVFLLFSLIWLSNGYSQLTYTLTPSMLDLTNYFQGIGLTISNMTVAGAPNSFGLFSGTSNMSFGSGIIMSTGDINNFNSPASTLLSSYNMMPGSALGNGLSSNTTYDECRIEFDCVPSNGNLLFNFAFGSEEYNEYVGAQFNDVFGIFVSGPNPSGGNYINYNCANIPGTTTPVSVNSINNGLGTGPCVNCSYYIDNTNGTTVAYDGFTSGLQGLVPVIIGQTYHFTIIIDDVADGIYDSSIMFLANSFKSTTPCTGIFNCNISPTVAASGKTILYKKSLTGAMMDSVGSINVSSPTFTMAIPDSGRYILKFIPSSTLYQISYADTAISWQNALIFNNPCTNGASVNFICSPFASIGSGSGSISGKIVEGIGFGQKPSEIQTPGNPIGGIVVKGGKNPGAQFFAQTITDGNGDYSFNNLPDGNYFVLVDIPGLDTTSTHHVDIVGGNTINNLGFVAGSSSVNPSTNISVKETEGFNYDLHVFPNPTKNQFNIEFLVNSMSDVSIQITDILGKYTKNLFYEDDYIGKYSSNFNLNIKPGIYLVKTTINNKELFSKLIILE